ncbi:UPF0398 protein [Paenibacillus baekrokdamisoli]|uniref:UPF0398 protein Back11_35690 n=1 Tax=Paenibacillus baekrokdamisoli TaxID=1712516 RepID=A0A3G9JGF1_9BACL|nr:DUF1273 domain-containing protein [Paenibacillus baekrokdamisoli]MBB3070838.1 putative phage-like protein YoqJ [Paenibacillus baekrokdamisoli]BBH22224.1 UPF0398 protein [Paenibacillus baekrokdamisoli]
MKRILITGYKATELGIYSMKHPGIDMIKKAIRKQLIPWIEEGLSWVIVSGQWGVELWAAEVAIELKASYPDLRLAVITPFLEQEEKWNDQKKEIYNGILTNADYVNSVTKKKYDGPWQFKEKDRFLLQNSDGLLLMYDEEQDGSPKYIKELALKHALVVDYPIFTITGEDLQHLAEDEQFNQFDE